MPGRKATAPGPAKVGERYRHVFEHVPVAIWEMDISEVWSAFKALQAEGVSDLPRYVQNHPEFVLEALSKIKTLGVNAQALKLTGTTSKEQLMASMDRLFTPETWRIFSALLIGVVKGKRYFEAETEMHSLEGKAQNVLLRISLPDPGPEPRYVLASVLDITARKRMEEELERRAQELARSNADLEQFAYVVSHDLKEPLRMISSYVKLLEKRYGSGLDPDAREFIGYATDGARRMSEMIEDILRLSRVGTRGKEFEAVDCNRILEMTLVDLRPAIVEAGAVVTHDPLPTVRADPSQFRQLFQNLLVNAIKFRGEEAPRIHVSAEASEGRWRFSVRDNGIGIDPKHADRVFAIFQRLHGRDDFPGTGIGLAICKKIAERHGGRIWVESKPGEGTTFFFTLPPIED